MGVCFPRTAQQCYWHGPSSLHLQVAPASGRFPCESGSGGGRTGPIYHLLCMPRVERTIQFPGLYRFNRDSCSQVVKLFQEKSKFTFQWAFLSLTTGSTAFKDSRQRHTVPCELWECCKISLIGYPQQKVNILAPPYNVDHLLQFYLENLGSLEMTTFV